MDSLNNVLKPKLLNRIKEVMVSAEISVIKCNRCIYKLSNQALQCGYIDVADFFLDRISLYDAIQWNSVVLVRQLLDRQASITSVIDSDFNTPLHYAFLCKRFKIVEMFIYHLITTSNYKNMKNKDGLTHLHIISARGKKVEVQKFLNAGADIGDVVKGTSSKYKNYTALHFACDAKSLGTIRIIRACKTEQTKRLIKNYDFQNVLKDLESPKSIQDMVKSVVIHLYKEASDPIHPGLKLSDFHLACFTGSVQKVKEYLDEGTYVNYRADVNMKFCSMNAPLHFAIEGNVFTYEKVQLLLAYGADVEQRNGNCMTPLHSAFHYSDFKTIDKTVKLLYDALTNKMNNLMDCRGLTYFHIAVAMNDFKTVECFFRENKVTGYEIVMSNTGKFSLYTPLHFAVKFRRLEMANVLIEHGANVNSIGNVTPLQLACEAGHTSLIDLLIKKGAVVNEGCLTNDGKTLLHLFIDSIVNIEENLYYLKRKNFRNHQTWPEQVRHCIKQLANYIDINAEDNNGNTILHTVCSNLFSRSLYAKDLLMNGADINLENKNGETPFELALNFKLRQYYEEFRVLEYQVRNLKALGLEVNPKNEKCCMELMEKKNHWYNICEDHDKKIFEANEIKINQEIEKLKSVMLVESVSLFDYLRMDVSEAANYNLEMKKYVDLIDNTEFILCKGFLLLQFKKSLKYVETQSNERKRDNESSSEQDDPAIKRRKCGDS